MSLYYSIKVNFGRKCYVFCGLVYLKIVFNMTVIEMYLNRFIRLNLKI